MIVIIPTTSKQVSQRVLSGLAGHDVLTIYNEAGQTQAERRANMCAAVNSSSPQSGIWAKIDDDVLLEPGDLEACSDFLTTYPSYDAVAIDTKHNATSQGLMPPEWLWRRKKKLANANIKAKQMYSEKRVISGLHVCCAAIVLRGPYTFQADDQHCWCMAANRDLRIRYLDDRMRFELKCENE